MRSMARKDTFVASSMLSPSIPSQPSPRTPVFLPKPKSKGSLFGKGGVKFSDDDEKDADGNPAKKQALVVNQKRRLARLKTMRLDRMGSDAMLLKGGKAERPAVEYSLWSCDPHRVVKEDGKPFTHNFRCLAQHNQNRIKMLICITAYAETWDEIKGTIAGVVNNMCTLQRWHEEHAAGKRSWGDSAQLRASCMNLKPHEIAVMVVFDGRLKASKTIFEGETAVLTPAHRDAMAEAVKPMNDNPRPAHSDVREAHIFEMDYIAERSRGELANCPLNLIFCIKEKNGGKLNSHVWFFRCFSPLLRPRYCVLLDAGTVPDPTAILHLYADMEENVHIGGCAGEICVDPSQQNVFDLVVSAQTFEYTAANLLDKAFESVMGFISVLPGAFSAYRYEAIAGVPLNVYFRLEDQDAATLSPGQANAYLAEDRLLGFEIVAKRGCKYVLHYNHQSRAFTDVPATIGMLVRQRRRWMNGSLFAQLMALGAWSRLISQTRHNIFRKIGFCLLFVYHVLAMGLSFLLLGNAYFGYALLFRVLSNQLTSMTGSADAGAVVNTAFTVMMWIFQLILLTLFVYSLGNRPEESETVWSVCVHLLGGFNTVSSALLIWMIRDWTTNWQIWTGGLTAFGAILVCALFQRRFANIASTLFQYIWQVPMYLFILPIYSLCNTNDVSWGTREAHATAQQAELKAKMDRNFREFRSRIVIMWILVNLLFSQFLDSFSAPTAQQQASGQNVNNNALTNYVIIIACVSAFMLGLRVIGCFIYVGLEWIKYANCMNKGPNKCCRKHAPQYSRAGRPTMFDGVLAGLGMKKTFSGYESNMGSMAGMAHHNNSMFNPSPPGGGGLPTFGQSSLSSASRSAAALAAIKEAGTEVDDDDSGSDTGPKEGASKVMSSPGFGGARTMYGSGGTEGDSKGTATPSTAANALNLYKSSPRSILKGSSGGSTTSLLRSASKKVGLSSDAGEDVATGLTAQTPNRMPSSKFAIPGSSRTLTSDPMANTYGSLAEGDNEDGADDEDGAGVEGGVGEYSEEDYYANIPEGYYLASDGNIYPLPAGGIEELEQYRDQLAAAAAAANGGIPEGDENEEEGDEDDNNVSADSTSINVMSADGKPSDGDEAVNSEAEDDSARSDGRSQMQRLDSLLRAQTFVATSASGAISKPSGKFVPPGAADTTATNAAAAPRRNSLVGASDQPS